ncbi:MAG: cytidine deaminase [Planctomycetaceae bacterium]|nr:cytidine deaminase [Planctomycetales bacterium]MCB9926597.1 cytidine deaminase [Planctomycetaceae bacterium]
MNKISDELRQTLIEAALTARQRAYIPYSRFPVGAAVVADDGTVFSGCNVENASFGLTNCAERTAVFTAIAAGRSRFLALAVATEGGYSPCGACRQVLAEFCDDLPILIVDTGLAGQVDELSLADLLPRRFARRQSDGR